MQKFKIGVWDDEIEYVTRLTAFLQKYGKGKWDVSAFTDEKTIQAYLKKNSLDLIVGTDEDGLKIFREDDQISKLWLTDDAKKTVMDKPEWNVLYRFQSVDVIGKKIKQIIKEKQCNQDKSKWLVAIYSPIGRCGKTTFALDFVKTDTYGRWLYVGMEDYSSFGDNDVAKKEQADDFFYYWKTHNEERVKSYLKSVDNVIASGNSFFDARQVNNEDIVWLRKVIQSSNYRGILFDVGSGVLQDFHMLKIFDVVLVPYVEEESALKKRSNFEAMFRYQEMEGCRDYTHYLNMTKKSERENQIQHIFGGDE